MRCSGLVNRYPDHIELLDSITPPFFFPLFREIPRLGVQSESELPAYPTATAMQDPSRVCDPHNSSRQCQILNPLSEARDQTHIFMDPIGFATPELWQELQKVFILTLLTYHGILFWVVPSRTSYFSPPLLAPYTYICWQLGVSIFPL